MDPNRRRLLLGLSAAGVAAGALPLLRRAAPQAPAVSAAVPVPVDAPPAQRNAAEAFANALRRPGAEGLLAEVDLSQSLTLTARVGAMTVFDGAPTELWYYAATINGRQVANPLLRVRHGDEIDVSLRNQLSEDTTIHWHGLPVDEANDGSGLHPVRPGASARYRFRVTNRAGLYWYHAHPHGRTGVQLQRGLAGLLQVDDDEERALRDALGLPWGERDLPLMLTDKQVDTTNAIVYREHEPDDWIGNRVLVNWTPDAYLDVLPGLYRLRLANVANARMFRPAFVHNDRELPFFLIGTDGGLLRQPWPMESLFLAPAQRADLLVDFSALPVGARVLLRSLDYVAMENEDESGAFAPDPMGDHPGAMRMGAALDLMEFRVRAPARSIAAIAIPTALSAIAPPPDTRAWPVRKFRLRMDADGTWLINDWNFHRTGHAAAFAVKRGTCEVWEIRNHMTSMPHPIHLHGFQFRVVSRSISPTDIRARQVAPGGLTPQDMGWSDTVVVWPGEIVRLALDFSQPFRGTQNYMLHCHNLEHEDKGMMVTFAVTD
ncbi:MAG: multicopper oxidase domain-containing protein [Tahibacter sp.]